jgi:hypothetical protein
MIKIILIVLLFVLFLPTIDMLTKTLMDDKISSSRKGAYLLSTVLALAFACVFLILLYNGMIIPIKK